MMSLNFTLISKKDQLEDNLIKAYEIETQLEGKELEQYYIKNGIMPMNAPEGTGELVVATEDPDHPDWVVIDNYLSTIFNTYSNWGILEGSTKSVSDVYGEESPEIEEDFTKDKYGYIENSKEEAGINYPYIGCGYQKFGGGLLTLSNEYKVYESLNGSYILNDGTIYLVDEDINPYFNNTLEFYLINNNELM